jgi:flagellar hook-length control protein FliK
MDASTCAAAPSVPAAPAAPGHAAASRARKLAAAAAAAEAPDAKPGFAELLERRLGKARADATASALTDHEADAADARSRDAAAHETDNLTAVPVPSDPGSPAWWAQRMRLSASNARAGAAAAAAEPLQAAGHHGALGAADAAEGRSGIQERAPHAGPLGKGHSAGADSAFGQAPDAPCERVDNMHAADPNPAQPFGEAGPAITADAAKPTEPAAAALGGEALNPLAPPDGLTAARTDQAAAAPQPPVLPSRDIAPPVTSPAFAPALGEVMTLLLSEGTHEARLQLNPQELGPVTVKIELDGAQAHVHFVAGAAEARDALQAAMPLLQQALQESGLSLAGGGVFGRDASSGQAQDGRDRRSAQRPAADRDGDGTGGTGGTVRRITRGVIDFYA